MRKKFNGRIGGNGAVRRGGDELAEIFGTAITSGKEASEIGGTRIIGNNETRLIKEEKTFEIAIFEDSSEGRKTTNFDEEAGNRKNLLIFEDEGIEMMIFVGVAGENFLIIENFNIGGILNLGN